MGMRLVLMWAVVVALALPIVAMAEGETLYSAARTGAQPLVDYSPWGSGEVEEAEGEPGVVITTTGYYEGARFTFSGVRIEDVIRDLQNGFLTLSVKVEQTASTEGGMMGPGMSGSGGSMMGPGGRGMMGSGGPGMMGAPGMMGSGGPAMMGSGGPGMMGSGGPGMMGGAPGMMGGGEMGDEGGMGPGMMGGSGGMMGGMYGAQTVIPKELGRIRVVLVTDAGEYAIEGLDVHGIPSREGGWDVLAASFKDLALSGAMPTGEVKEVRVFGDAEGKITVSDISLMEEDPEDVVTPKAPEDATYEWGEPFDLRCSVDEPDKQYRLHWDLDDRDGVDYTGETGEVIEDANYYFNAPGVYVVTVIAVPVTNRALPRIDRCRITINAPAGQQGMGMGGGMMGPGMGGPMMGPGMGGPMMGK